MTVREARSDHPGSAPDYRGKRMLDLGLASVALIICSPLVLVLSLGVRLSSPGPVLHRATRAGRRGEPFTLLKFRSMRPNSSAQGPAITAAGDPRITRFGRLLRRSKLDELPQLINVLKGEMSIVGPRPEDPRYVERYTAEQRRILAWRPGITSPASVTFRDEETILAAAVDLEATYRAVMAEKIGIDLEYFERATLVGDLAWMGRTVFAVAH